MSGLRRHMAGYAMLKDNRIQLHEWRKAGGDDIAIEDYRDPLMPSGNNSAGDGRSLATAEMAQECKRISETVVAGTRKSLINGSRFACDALGIMTGSRAHPVGASPA